MAPAYFCKIQHYCSCDFCALTGLGTDRNVCFASLYYGRECLSAASSCYSHSIT